VPRDLERRLRLRLRPFLGENSADQTLAQEDMVRISFSSLFVLRTFAISLTHISFATCLIFYSREGFLGAFVTTVVFGCAPLLTHSHFASCCFVLSRASFWHLCMRPLFGDDVDVSRANKTTTRFWIGHLMGQFDYMVCAQEELTLEFFQNLKCDRDPTFIPSIPVNVPEWLEKISGSLGIESLKLGKTVLLMPFMWDALNLSIFASLVAPFGGFFASGECSLRSHLCINIFRAACFHLCSFPEGCSLTYEHVLCSPGFKRAFKIKDFGDLIPGWTPFTFCIV
jgi:hypothetical protein